MAVHLSLYILDRFVNIPVLKDLAFYEKRNFRA